MLADNMQGNRLLLGITVACGSGFFLFGYDQGVFGGILNNQQFLDTFNTPDATIQAQIVSAYYLGAFFGAVFSQFIGDRIGRRRAIILGCTLLTVGGALQSSSSGLPQMIVGRIIGGLGTGLNTTAIPMWQVETCPKTHRGKLVILELVLNIFGICVTTWMNYGFTYLKGNSVSWRFPLAFQCFWSMVTLLLAIIMPESPRWLVLKGRQEEAKALIARLIAKPLDSTEVNIELQVLLINVTHEVESQRGKVKEIFHNGRTQTLRRILLGAGLALMQQACGVNIIANYLPIVLTRSVGLSDRLALILSACNSMGLMFWATMAMSLIESFGRKKLLLLGALGQGICFFMVAVGVRVGGQGMSIFAVAFIFVYEVFFGLSYLHIPWLYPAEINSQGMRNVGTSISTATNWLFVYVVVLVTPYGIDNLGWSFYLMFGCFNLCFLPFVYYFYVETAGLSLEQIDRVFEFKYEGGKGMRLSEARKQVLLESPEGIEKEMALEALGAKNETSTAHLETETYGTSTASI
jgi:sugar porter (SP) family MFS transporter